MDSDPFVQIRSNNLIWTFSDMQGCCGGIRKSTGGQIGLGISLSLSVLGPMENKNILVLGYGAGFIQSELSQSNAVTTIELNEQIIDMARHDTCGEIIKGDAYEYILNGKLDDFDIIIFDIDGSLQWLTEEERLPLVLFIKNGGLAIANCLSATTNEINKIRSYYSDNTKVHCVENMDQTIMEMIS